MAKSKNKPKIKTNSFCGTPGSKDFEFKLPKHITISSIDAALFHILKGDFEHVVLDEEQYVAGELKLIYPNLNEGIARHFCIIAIQDGRHHASDTRGTDLNVSLFENVQMNEPSLSDLTSNNPIDCDNNEPQLSPVVVPENASVPTKCPPSFEYAIQDIKGQVINIAKDLNELKEKFAEQIEKNCAASKNCESKSSQTYNNGINSQPANITKTSDERPIVPERVDVAKQSFQRQLNEYKLKHENARLQAREHQIDHLNVNRKNHQQNTEFQESNVGHNGH